MSAIKRPPSPEIHSLPQSCLRSAFSSQSASLLWDFYVPTYTFLPSGTYEKPWMTMIQDLSDADQDPAQSLAFKALASCRLGKQARDERLIRESEKLYSQALWELQRALWDEGLMYKNETLYACMLLSLYEVLEGSAERGFGYLSHTSGANRLLQLRGPLRHISGKSHALFLGQRLNGTIHAITTRRSNFLKDAEWLTVPWLENDKDIRHQLIDVMLEIPVLTERFDALPRVPQSPAGYLALLDLCADLERRFTQWYQHAESQAPPTGLYWSKPAPPSHNSNLSHNPFPTEFEFPNHLHAQTMLLYWAGLLLTYGTLQRICRTLRQLYPSGLPPDVTPSSFDFFNLPPHTDVRPYAANIASSVEYFMQSDMRALGTNLMSFPVGVASYYYKFFFQLEPPLPNSGSASPPDGIPSPPASPNGVAGWMGNSNSNRLLADKPNYELMFFANKFRKMQEVGFSMGDFLNSLLEDVSLNLPKGH